MKKLGRGANITLFVLLIILTMAALFEVIGLFLFISDTLNIAIIAAMAATSLLLPMYVALTVYYGKKSFLK